MRKRRWHFWILVALMAALMTLFKVPMASSQGTTLVAVQVAGDLPIEDLDSPAWQQATAVEVPLSAQTVTKPMNLETRVKSVTARALHDGSRLAVLIEWLDDTRNDQTIRVQDFRDSVALQFPLVDGQPFFCMGMQGGNVDIWHWKADWQADIAAWQDMETVYPDMDVDQYPFASGELPAPSDYQDVNYVPALASGNLFASPRLSPVEDIVAGGFGSLTAESVEGQSVQGYGEWADGKWRVIFSRDLTANDPDDASFTAGKVYSMAFAAWDGANGERNGEKSTSQWVSLQLQGSAGAPAASVQAERPAAPGFPVQTISYILYGAALLLIIIGAIIYFRLPE